MAVLDAENVREALQRLSASAANIFGSKTHRFQLNAPFTDEDILSFEKVRRVDLPSEYRRFITAIANGGAGTFCDVFPLGKWNGRAGSILSTGVKSEKPGRYTFETICLVPQVERDCEASLTTNC